MIQDKDSLSDMHGMLTESAQAAWTALANAQMLDEDAKFLIDALDRSYRDASRALGHFYRRYPGAMVWATPDDQQHVDHGGVQVQF